MSDEIQTNRCGYCGRLYGPEPEDCQCGQVMTFRVACERHPVTGTLEWRVYTATPPQEGLSIHWTATPIRPPEKKKKRKSSRVS